ncbi:MAG: sporulation transcriptional regulator SpoIIID [Bacilli bacterium]|nr:sporulation transcriptional regulator SpoIIID [Bacilli bacterium]MDD4076491.1 sporulation transcriptional regulator SpoIIID [Bacilli bacterium]MDD4387758.1 sporulation transcriptional regulator SpoIIID [Bacilli bacterium]
MDYDIRLRVIKTAEIFLADKSTVRGVAKKVDCSKSTVHKDLTERLPLLNKNLFLEVRNLLEYNKSIRHIRGGEATKRKFMEARQGKPEPFKN